MPQTAVSNRVQLWHLLLLAAAMLPAIAAFPFPPLFGWGCPPCDQSSCPPAPCANTSQIMDECGCCVLCAKEEGEKCGGEGDVGGTCNDGLYCARRLGRIFGEARLGVCEVELCRRAQCTYRQRCSLLERNTLSPDVNCNCHYFRCANKHNPVCGRNGVQYDSVCALQEAECLGQGPIGILNMGECPPSPPTPPTSTKKTNTLPPLIQHPTPEDLLTEQPNNCRHNRQWYRTFDIVPPTSGNPCTYYVCSESGYMDQYRIPGCEGAPYETDWEVDMEVLPPGWTEWSDFSQCVGNCSHGGWRNHSRTCTNPAPSTHPETAEDVSYCDGEEVERELCAPENCTMCNYTEWSEWSQCSTTCDEGVQMRYRNVVDPPVPELCVPTEEDVRPCYSREDCAPCRKKALDEPVHIRNTENGCFSLWAEYDVLVCAGQCSEGQCCHPIGQDSSGIESIQQQPGWEVECPDNPGKPDVENYRYYPLLRCECRACNETYESHRDWPPYYLMEPWVIEDRDRNRL